MDDFIVDVCTQHFEYYDHQYVPPTAACHQAPCQNGGSCINNIDFTDYYCTCTADWTGKDCDMPIPCQWDPCMDGQFTTCTNSDDYTDFTCECTEEYRSFKNLVNITGASRF